MLNRLREGHHTVDDINILIQHVKDEDNQMSSFPHLLTTRKEVQLYNTVVYNEAERDKKVSIKAIDWVIGTFNTNIQSKVLQRIPDDS